MMTETTNPADHASPAEGFGDLPIQPTGSGVADLEIAYEQMKLAEQAEADVGSVAVTPIDTSDAAVESAAHPS
jgi:hypothetical protein